ncbi:MAG: DUF1178 family protein [Roseovarius sp.]
MIRFSLRCDREHSFDSWFQSAAAYDKLASAGMVACAVWGSTVVQKALMAPSVRPSRDRAAGAAAPAASAGAAPQRPLSTPASAAEQMLAELRRFIESRSEYVGADFAREARDIHEGLAPHRLIHGEARLDEARRLIEDGVPVAPLPFRLGRKQN